MSFKERLAAIPMKKTPVQLLDEFLQTLDPEERAHAIALLQPGINMKTTARDFKSEGYIVGADTIAHWRKAHVI